MAQLERIWKINGREPLNPTHVLATASERGWSTEWAGKANSLHCPRGRFPGMAHFLVDQDVKAAIGTGPVDIKFEEREFDGTSWQLKTEETWTGYYAIRSQAVSKDNEAPPHWVTLADRRWLLERSACNERYNLRRSKSAYIPETLNGGTPWTWAEIFADLWALLPGVAGSAPSLPVTPSSTPENLIWEGVPTWQAITQLLTTIGCVAILDPYEGTFSIVQASATQPGLSTLKSLNEDRLLWKYSPAELPTTNLPSKATVTFHLLPGEDTTMDPFHAVPEVEDASIPGGGFGTAYAVTDPMWAYDTNASQRATRAAEIAAAIGGLMKPLGSPWGAVYAGLVGFLPGAEITDVTWTSDGANGFRTIAKYSTAHLEWPPHHLLTQTSAGSSDWIEFTITSMTTATSSDPDFIGLKKATVEVRGASPAIAATLVGESVIVYDHSGCIFDLPDADMVGYTGWAQWSQFRTLDTNKDCEILTPAHWAAFNRCCEPDTGTYRDCPVPP